MDWYWWLLLAIIILVLLSRDSTSRKKRKKELEQIRLKEKRANRSISRESKFYKKFLGRRLNKEVDSLYSLKNSESITESEYLDKISEINKNNVKYVPLIKNHMEKLILGLQGMYLKINKISKKWPEEKKIEELEESIINESVELKKLSKKYEFIKDLFPNRYKK